MHHRPLSYASCIKYSHSKLDEFWSSVSLCMIQKVEVGSQTEDLDLI